MPKLMLSDLIELARADRLSREDFKLLLGSLDELGPVIHKGGTYSTQGPTLVGRAIFDNRPDPESAYHVIPRGPRLWPHGDKAASVRFRLPLASEIEAPFEPDLTTAEPSPLP